MAQTPAARRRRSRGIIVRAVGAVAIVAVCFFGTTFMSPEDAEAVLNAGSTDPVAYAEGAYDSTIALSLDHKSRRQLYSV